MRLSLLCLSLGFALLNANAAEVNLPMAAPPAKAPAARGKTAAPSKTTITSQTLEMVSGVTDNIFYFSKNVHVVGTDLDMKADQMVVTALHEADEQNDISRAIPSGKNKMGTIEKIVAVGNVHILQQGRESFSGHAEFFPKDSKVILTEDPRVIDSQAIVTGWRITLFQNDKRVIVEQDPAGGARPTVNLDALPNMSPVAPKSATLAGAKRAFGAVKPATSVPTTSAVAVKASTVQK
jgi:lipopolysaccharide export system protein LptA